MYLYIMKQVRAVWLKYTCTIIGLNIFIL